MSSLFHVAVAIFWIAWVVIWAVSARGAKSNQREEDGLTRLAYGLPLWIAAWLLVGRGLPWTFLYGRFVPDGVAIEALGALVTVAGLAFAIWARVHLGSNWSAMVTVKQDHELIRSGPYRYVRHPIYSGLLLAILGTALAFGEWRDLVALVLVFGSCWYKLLIEERWMAETFGEEYRAYKSRVAALVPGLI